MSSLYGARLYFTHGVAVCRHGFVRRVRVYVRVPSALRLVQARRVAGPAIVDAGLWLVGCMSNFKFLALFKMNHDYFLSKRSGSH